MSFFSHRVILAALTVVVVTGCGAEPDPAASAARFVTTSGVAAPPEFMAGEKVLVRTARQAIERAVLAEAARLAAEQKAAVDAQLAAAAAQAAAAEAAAVRAAAAERVAAERVAAERAAAERVAAEQAAAAARTAASRAARQPALVPAAARTAPAPARAPEPARAAAPVAPPRAVAPALVSSGTGQSGYEAEILALTNGERTRAGLSPLQRSSCAAERAGTWSQNLAATGTLSHQALAPVLSACGAQRAAENVAFGNISAAQMVANWMNSSGHRANILNPALTHLGVGAVQRSDGRWYGTQVFLTL